ncbi:SDR family NAD(P)-dependent oxidoreductase [Nocardioides caldifontis]|uniref:SDR family NAD(P)-dependent oxidoreductase n=1 Tax=Nocardioides caldifontis TaxID=2588938 RepID=UPI00193A1A69|nr:SDR family oxidoreductase [Nocardioides caldifontis]
MPPALPAISDGGRVVLVTGGGRGIGRAVVERFRAEGAVVATCGRGERPHLPDDVLWVRANVGDPVAVDGLLAQVEAELGPVAVLVNNAGAQVERTVADSTDDDWERVVGTNCRGVFNLCRAVLPEMSERGGVIVNIGSISALVADPSMALYNASKAFVHGLTRSITVDHGPAVRCNTVAPGWVGTEMAGDAFALASDVDAARADAVARHPAGRLGRPEDVSAVVAWLASDEAAFVTGQCFTVDGGLTSGSPLRPTLF